MIKQNAINNKMVDIRPNDTESIKMNKYKAYSVQAYSHTITIYHDNAQALSNDVNVYDFASNALKRITLQIGAGNELYDLDLTAHLIRQLEVRKQLIYTIDRTQGDNKISTIELIVDFLSLNFVSPKDTILFNTGSYDHLLTQIEANTGEAITDCTVTKTNVRITEVFKTDVNLPLYKNPKGELVSMTPKNKKPIHRMPSFNSDNSAWEIELPNGVSISKIILYVTDGGKISKGHIKNIQLKNAKQKMIEVDTQTLEAWNRETLKSYSNNNFNGIMVLDIAQGQYTESLNTLGFFTDSKLELDIKKNSANEPILNIIYETIEEA